MTSGREFGESIKLRLGIRLADVDAGAAQSAVESAVKQDRLLKEKGHSFIIMVLFLT